jgi:hypothetical protein
MVPEGTGYFCFIIILSVVNWVIWYLISVSHHWRVEMNGEDTLNMDDSEHNAL